MNGNPSLVSRVVVKPSRRRRETPDKAKVLTRSRRPKPIQLGERDIAVLRALAVHRFLSGEQLHRLVFPSRDASLSRRRLRALFDHCLVE